MTVLKKISVINENKSFKYSIFINLAMLFATTAFRIAQRHYASVFPLVYLQVLWSSLVGIYIFNE